MAARVLITGADGFVGAHLQAELGGRAVASETDVLDPDALAGELRAVQPDAVVHLAARSSVAESWQSVADVWQTNVLGTVNVLEALAQERPGARTLFPSTGEVYGSAEELPTPESAPLAPLSPYAATKAAAELACAQVARTSGLDIVVARSFNHEGPRRDDRFAIGSWTHQIAQLELEGGGTLRVGDLSAERDITDVRDVCRAYRLLLEPSVEAGTYNVASGRSVAMARVVELLVGLARVSVRVEHDPARRRPADIAVMRGDASRLRTATGWEPEIPLERTLADALAEARRAVREEPVATQ